LEKQQQARFYVPEYRERSEERDEDGKGESEDGEGDLPD
jgi:hypothetical protein